MVSVGPLIMRNLKGTAARPKNYKEGQRVCAVITLFQASMADPDARKMDLAAH